MYVAMYDEIDEGTAMYKMAKTQEECPVLNPSLVPLNEDGYDLPGDWYLQIGTEIQKMLEGKIPLTANIPINPDATAVKFFKKKDSLILFPVPAKNKLYISNGTEAVNYKILNINGSVILKGKLNNSSIDVSSLRLGLYLLQLDGNVARFVKH